MRIDPEGLDYWLEDADPSEAGLGLHQSVCVGKYGTSNRFCISFGRKPGQGDCWFECDGHVYQDRSPPGDVLYPRHRETDAATDRKIKRYLRSRLGEQRPWDAVGGENCRVFSQQIFDYLDKTLVEKHPPHRIPILSPRCIEARPMKMLRLSAACAVVLMTLVGCDKQVQQTVVVRANIASADVEALWLTEASNCSAPRIKAGWYRDGLWIFRLSSTRGGVGTVTQELAVCARGEGATAATPTWHSVHGGGAPLIVLSCVLGEKDPCRMYQDGYTEGAWSEEPAQ